MTYRTRYENLSIGNSITSRQTDIDSSLNLSDLNNSYFENQSDPGYGLFRNPVGLITAVDTKTNLVPPTTYGYVDGSLNYNQQGIIHNSSQFSIDNDVPTTGYTYLTSNTNYLTVTNSNTVPLLSVNDYISLDTDYATLYKITGIQTGVTVSQSRVTTVPSPPSNRSGSVFLTPKVNTPRLKTQTFSSSKVSENSRIVATGNCKLPASLTAICVRNNGSPQIIAENSTNRVFYDAPVTSDVPWIVNDGLGSFTWIDYSDPTEYLIEVRYNFVISSENATATSYNPKFLATSGVQLLQLGTGTILGNYAQYSTFRLTGGLPRMSGSAIVRFQRDRHYLRVIASYTNPTDLGGNQVQIIRDLPEINETYTTRIGFTLLGRI